MKSSVSGPVTGKQTTRKRVVFWILSNSISFHIVSNLLSQPHNSCLAVLLFSSLATCTQDKHRIFSDFDPNTLHYFCLCCPFTFIMKYTKHFRRNARFSMDVCVWRTFTIWNAYSRDNYEFMSCSFSYLILYSSGCNVSYILLNFLPVFSHVSTLNPPYRSGVSHVTIG